MKKKDEVGSLLLTVLLLVLLLMLLSADLFLLESLSLWEWKIRLSLMQTHLKESC